MFDARYERGELLGKGGMGEVLLCNDRDLGRQVAVKISRSSNAVSQEMFIREARIQGQLEHPAIVPVYDFGRLPDGQPYFVMKRVRGTSLAELIKRLREGDPTAAKYTRTKLLGAFVSVCLAIDFAHSKEVIHRDLKPANVMLGEFGEVYVLDWGIVKLVGEAEPGGVPSTPDPDDVSFETTIGGVFGTPGYMAPEQLNGEIDAISIRTDVFALGAILYEILTLRALRTRDAPPVAKSGLPPELAVIVERAVAVEISQRWASVREMADAVDRFLEGDRDQAVRQTQAVQYLESAKLAMSRAKDPTSNEHDERARALRDAARAMALAPKSDVAAHVLLRVLLEPPRTLPKEAERELEDDWMASRRVSAKIAVFSSVVTMVLISYGLLLGVREWGLFMLAYLVTALAGALALLGATGRPKGPARYVVLACWMALVLILTRLFGPLILVPTIVAGVLVPMLLNAFEGSRGVVVIGCSLIPVVMLLELLGVIPSSYLFAGDMMCIQPQLTSFPPHLTLSMLFVAQLGTVLLLLLQVVGIRDRHLLAEKKLRLHAWYLKRLVG